jgi:hypothetical protein
MISSFSPGRATSGALQIRTSSPRLLEVAAQDVSAAIKTKTSIKMYFIVMATKSLSSTLGEGSPSFLPYLL